MVVDIPDVVTYTNFGDHRLRGFWVAGDQISPSPIDFHRRPYNTLALPCERVIRFSALPGESVRALRSPFSQRLSLAVVRKHDVIQKNRKYVTYITTLPKEDRETAVGTAHTRIENLTKFGMWFQYVRADF